MKSPVTDEMDAKIERDTELKAETEFALGKWAELKGYESDGSRLYKTDANGTWLESFLIKNITIDYPFMHELINGLESESDDLKCEYYEFKRHLRNILYDALAAQGVERVNMAQSDQYQFTASVPNLLRAYYRCFNGS